MKKVLLATTALMLVAGAAAAEVKISGSARMGVVGGYFVDTNGDTVIGVGDDVDYRFSSRFRVNFDASAESDSGLSFGASVRNDQSGVGGVANGDSTVWVKGAFGKVTMGDAGNAPDSLVGQVSGVGYTGNGDYNEIGFIGFTATGVQYDYSSGPFSVAVGLGQIDAASEYKSIAVKYATDTWSIALGHEDTVLNSQTSLLGSVTFGDATVKAKLADQDVGNGDVAAALSVDYKTGAATITAFATSNRDFAGTDTAGLGVAYDLGGGATFAAGVSDNGTDTIADAGLKFSF